MERNRKIYLFAITIFIIFFVLCPLNPALALSQDTVAAVNNVPYLGPLFTFIIDTIKSLLKGVVFLITAVSLLQVAVDSSPQWININSSNFVKTGLSFTTTLADIFLIIVFIVIAIGYVFKLDSIKAEQSLPKFFISALLIHFAPLFVGIIIDISNILLHGLTIGQDGLFVNSFSGFVKDITLSCFALISPYGAALALSWVGSASTISNIAIGGLILANMTVGIPYYLIQDVTMGILSAILFSYAVFFLTRVFVIQLLAIISPLAILARAIPQTKKFWDLWVDWLVGWSFGGILVIFLLSLGLTCLDMLGTLPTATISFDAFGAIGWSVSSYMNWVIYWLAIAIYMMTVEAFCFIAFPALAKSFTEKIKGGGKKSFTGAKKAAGQWSTEDEENQKKEDAKNEAKKELENQ